MTIRDWLLLRRTRRLGVVTHNRTHTHKYIRRKKQHTLTFTYRLTCAHVCTRRTAHEIHTLRRAAASDTQHELEHTLTHSLLICLMGHARCRDARTHAHTRIALSLDTQTREHARFNPRTQIHTHTHTPRDTCDDNDDNDDDRGDGGRPSECALRPPEFSSEGDRASTHAR